MENNKRLTQQCPACGRTEGDEPFPEIWTVFPKGYCQEIAREDVKLGDYIQFLNGDIMVFVNLRALDTYSSACLFFRKIPIAEIPEAKITDCFDSGFNKKQQDREVVNEAYFKFQWRLGNTDYPEITKQLLFDALLIYTKDTLDFSVTPLPGSTGETFTREDMVEFVNYITRYDDGGGTTEQGDLDQFLSERRNNDE